jgi:hypothetical protein
MRSNLNHRSLIVLTGCVALAVMTTGCRSGKSGSMFSFRNEPSAEALAGNGPTTTYPTPPSVAAVPEAIASVAGGTASPTNAPITPAATSATAQVAGLNVTPGYVTPASQNMGAARANGFPATPASHTIGTQPTTPPAISPGVMTPAVTAPKTSPASGYQFGTNSAAPESSYNIPSSYTAPATAPQTSGAAVGTAGGFTLPSDLGAVAPAASSGDACESCEGCDSCQGSAPSPGFTPSAAASAGGYSPGSLSGAGDYPGGK